MTVCQQFCGEIHPHRLHLALCIDSDNIFDALTTLKDTGQAKKCVQTNANVATKYAMNEYEERHAWFVPQTFGFLFGIK